MECTIKYAHQAASNARLFLVEGKVSASPEIHALERLGETPIRQEPFPHCVVTEIFPAEFYAQIQAHFPTASEMVPLKETGRAKGYDERFVVELKQASLNALSEERRAFWQRIAEWLKGENFKNAVLRKFRPFVEAQFANVASPEFVSDAMLVEDKSNYTLGPHTDSSGKVITFLFYLPGDDSISEYGTSIYVPKSEKLRDVNSIHFPPAFFNRVLAVPFLPNTLLAFVKSDKSFHGVEPFRSEGKSRRLLLFDIRTAKPHPKTRDYSALPAKT